MLAFRPFSRSPATGSREPDSWDRQSPGWRPASPITGAERPRRDTPPAILARTGIARGSGGRQWARKVVTAAAYLTLSQPLFEKCFNPIFACSTHDPSAFHVPETRRKPVFPRSARGRSCGAGRARREACQVTEATRKRLQQGATGKQRRAGIGLRCGSTRGYAAPGAAVTGGRKKKSFVCLLRDMRKQLARIAAFRR
jgi:hypothetical protein